MLQALIFDFDGVLVSSDGYRFTTVQKIAAKHGVHIPDGLIKDMRGRTTFNVLMELIPQNPELIDTIVSEYKIEQAQNNIQQIAPIDFTVEFVREYKGKLPIAVASMSSRSTIETLTRHFGIFDKFTQIVSREDVTNHKPDPEVYLKTAAKLNIAPQNCLVFEDTVIGVQAALSAHMQCSVVLNDLNNPSEFAHQPVKSFVKNLEDLTKATAYI